MVCDRHWREPAEVLVVLCGLADRKTIIFLESPCLYSSLTRFESSLGPGLTTYLPA